MNYYTKISLRVLVLLTLILSADFATENLAPDVGIWLHERFGDKDKYVFWGVLILSLIIFLIWTEKDKIFNSHSNNAIQLKTRFEENSLAFRPKLTEVYQKRLNYKLAYRHPINLRLKYSLEGTTTKSQLYVNKTIKSKFIKKDLISIFEKFNGRLLIVGEPGAGKTTLLLQLAISILRRNENLFPVIINIATWETRFITINQWLQELLPQMGFPKHIAKSLIEQNRILPLFDGLDELSQDKRKSCLGAIGEFGETNEVKYVISSRITEYTETDDAPVYCQIKVCPLTLIQIKKQINGNNAPEERGLLNAISIDELLADAIKIPFYLNITQALFSSMKTWSDFNFKALDVEGRRKELVNEFITKKLNNIRYPKYDVERWLSFLGSKMIENDLVDFELINLQYSWMDWKKIQLLIPKILYFIIISGIMGLPLGILIGAFAAKIYNVSLPLSIILGVLLIGVTTGANKNIISDLALNKYSNSVIQKFYRGALDGMLLGFVIFIMILLFSKTPFLTTFKTALIYPIFYGIFGGLFRLRIKNTTTRRTYFILMGLIGGICFSALIIAFSGFDKDAVLGIITLGSGIGFILGQINNIQKAFQYIPPKIFTKDIGVTKWAFDKLIFLTLYMAIFYFLYHHFFKIQMGIESFLMYIAMGAIFWFFGNLINNSVEFLHISTPYQRFISSMKSFHFSIIQHFLLRYQLFRKNLLPLRLVKFLREMTENHIMESEGGIESEGAKWRFRHKIIQKHIANGNWVFDK